jgi:hypothetical protein
VSERDLRKLQALIEKHLGSGWLDLSDWLRDQLTLDDIEQRLENNDIAGVIEEVRQAALKFAADSHQAYVTAGRETASWLDEQIDDRLIRFDETNERAVERAKANQVRAVQGLTEEQRTKIGTALIEGRERGDNPREVARRIRDGLGLSEPQEAAVDSYRRALEEGDFTNALGRELRDGRSDRLLVRVRKSDGALTADQIDSLVERYRANAVAHRAETIARDEGLLALHEGNEELYRQAIERGDVEAEALLREWNHAGGGAHSRPGHVKMDGQQRAFGVEFENPITGAKLRFPGDPAADVSETTRCRCAISTRLSA